MILVRARLRRDAQLAALARMLLPDDPDRRISASHRLVWSLFGGDVTQRRDFLWREDKPRGEEERTGFLILAAREPRDPHGLFDLEWRDFAPLLSVGDRLGFVLRANPTVQPGAPRGAPRPPRSDVVMHALRDLPPGEARAAARPDRVREAGSAWLTRQGEQAGFTLEPDRLLVEGYETWRLPREAEDGKALKPVAYSTVDFSGVLRVEEPERFVGALARGFGRAKAFGCGLMLIRRVAS